MAEQGIKLRTSDSSVRRTISSATRPGSRICCQLFKPSHTDSRLTLTSCSMSNPRSKVQNVYNLILAILNYLTQPSFIYTPITLNHLLSYFYLFNLFNFGLLHNTCLECPCGRMTSCQEKRSHNTDTNYTIRQSSVNIKCTELGFLHR